MVIREMTASEIAALPDQFYKDVDPLKTGFRFTAGPNIRIAGAFEGDRVVGVWALTIQAHSAPIWIAPDHRGESKETRSALWAMVTEFIKDLGARGALMINTGNPKVRKIIDGLGGKKIGTVYQLEV